MRLLPSSLSLTCRYSFFVGVSVLSLPKIIQNCNKYMFVNDGGNFYYITFPRIESFHYDRFLKYGCSALADPL